jgi:hypothetical protein
MCISRKHLAFLEAQNERDYMDEKITSETHLLFNEHRGHCQGCDRLDNGVQGDLYDECRLRILRYFVSAKRDDTERLVPMPTRLAGT